MKRNQPHIAGPAVTMGIEEEFQIVDLESRALIPAADSLMQSVEHEAPGEVHNEFHLSQIETASPVCGSLADVRAAVVSSRLELLRGAESRGQGIVAAGTHPFSHCKNQPFTPKDRYLKMAAAYQHIARELVIFGCHVHVGVDGKEDAVQVLNRARVWLVPLLALSANSPFWQGEDTGYASYRAELWSVWPMSGQPRVFQSFADYRKVVGHLVQCGAIDDATRIYWDMRLSLKIPTVEFRVADVCMTVNEAVMQAGLARGIARTCYEHSQAGLPYSQPPHEVLRAAHWHAARYGLNGTLINVHQGKKVPAHDLIRSLLAFTREALEELGDWDEVSALVEETLGRGNGASRQRKAYHRRGELQDVVDYLLAETARDTGFTN